MNVNIYNPYVREELELYHHGIAGQRWGSRNGPPYPLSAGAHSASEKKAGWRKSLSERSDDRKYAKAVKKENKLLKKEHKILRKEGKSDNWSNALNKTLNQEDKRHALEDKIGRERADRVNDKLRAKRNKSIKAAIKKKIDSITPEQKAKAKKVAITALKVAGAIAITAAAAYAGYKGINALNTYGARALKNTADSQRIINDRYHAISKASENAFRTATSSGVIRHRPTVDALADKAMTNYSNYIDKNLDLNRSLNAISFYNEYGGPHSNVEKLRYQIRRMRKR